MLHDEVVSDRPAKHRVEGSAIGALPGPVDHLVGQIAKPRGKPQAESFAESEDEVRVPVRIRVVLLDAVCILVEDAVHEMRRLAGVAADDLHRELGSLVGDMAVDADAPPHPEVAGQVAGMKHRGGGPEAHTVRRGGGPRAERGRQGQALVVGDENRDRLGQGLFPETPVVDPHELGVRDA